MEIKVNLKGMNEVDEAMERARKCMDELYYAIAAVRSSMQNIGAEITQPPERPEAE